METDRVVQNEIGLKDKTCTHCICLHPIIMLIPIIIQWNSFFSLSLSDYLQATRCSLTHFPDVLFFSLCTHTVADLQLLEPGACAEIHWFTQS